MSKYENITNEEYEALEGIEKVEAAGQIVKRTIIKEEAATDEFDSFIKGKTAAMITQGWRLKTWLSKEKPEDSECSACKGFVLPMSFTSQTFFGKPTTIYGISWLCDPCKSNDYKKFTKTVKKDFTHYSEKKKENQITTEEIKDIFGVSKKVPF